MWKSDEEQIKWGPDHTLQNLGVSASFCGKGLPTLLIKYSVSPAQHHCHQPSDAE